MAELNYLRVKVPKLFDVEDLHKLSYQYGFSISNPDNRKGNYYDFIVEGKQRIAGFDLFAVDSFKRTNEIYLLEYDKLTKWLEELI